MRTAEWGAHLLLDRANVGLTGRTVSERLDYLFTDGALGIMFNRLSSGEQTLVRCAQTLFNGTGEVTLESILRTLDRENKAALFEVLFSVYVDQ